ncbi:hypothetical protein [Fictibacillus sp. NRS-1165]|uniref:hypothetical protein n=1 Tax=Fictibacillus sp. NRS-1165 TaxID=3144463 RepID=UPI003D1FD235
MEERKGSTVEWWNQVPKWWNGLDQDYFEWINEMEEDLECAQDSLYNACLCSKCIKRQKNEE